jgi:hypothetical protein
MQILDRLNNTVFWLCVFLIPSTGQVVDYERYAVQGVMPPMARMPQVEVTTVVPTTTTIPGVTPMLTTLRRDVLQVTGTVPGTVSDPTPSISPTQSASSSGPNDSPNLLIPGLFGVGTAILSGVIGWLAGQHQRRIENQRWYAGFFMERKYKSIDSYLIALAACHDALRFYSDMMETTDVKDFNTNLEPKVSGLWQTWAIACNFVESIMLPDIRTRS